LTIELCADRLRRHRPGIRVPRGLAHGLLELRPSFQDGKVPLAVCAGAGVGSSVADSAGSAARAESRMRRSIP